MIPFKPYRLPHASSSWGGPFNEANAQAFIRPRGNVWTISIPKDAKRFQIFSHLKAFRIWDARGRARTDYKLNKVLVPFASRVPDESVVEVYANRSQVIVSDILYFHNVDMRGLPFQDRIASWWYMPPEFRSMSFFNESNFSRLEADLFSTDISKVLFKPNFVSYPRESSAKVYNWLQMGKPQNVDGRKSDARNTDIRHIGPAYRPSQPGAR